MNAASQTPTGPSQAWTTRVGVFDLETTGIDTSTARIVSAHVGVLDASGAVVSARDWLANPGIDIPEQASAVHGITTERARQNGRPAADVAREVSDAVRALFDEGTPVVIYNAPYDLGVLAAEAGRHGVSPIASTSPVIDPLVIDKAVDRYRKGKRTLEAAAAHYGVELSDAHDAGADAVAAGRVALAIAAKYPGELGIPVAELHERQAGWFREQSERFQEYMRRSKKPDFQASFDWPVR